MSNDRRLFTPVTDLVERRRLHGLGFRDREIAEMTGAKRNTITVWRLKEGLSSNSPEGYRKQLTAEQGSARMLLYQLGWSDHHIARDEGVDRDAIREWRLRKGLVPNYRRGVTERWRPRATIADVMKRVRRAIGYGLARDVAEDATADLFLAILSGKIPLDHIEAEARRFGNRALDSFASRFGPRSLDVDIGDSEGFTLLDTIADDRSSSWLEEMGATVW